MPIRPPTLCRQPGCNIRITQPGYCDKHKKERQRRQDQERGSAHQRGYDHRWRRARKYFLARNPLCKHCESEGQITQAAVVDHITPHKGDNNLFWDESNWQGLCKYHHDLKTATEDGGFGR